MEWVTTERLLNGLESNLNISLFPKRLFLVHLVLGLLDQDKLMII